VLLLTGFTLTTTVRAFHRIDHLPSSQVKGHYCGL
jgi:hypothetical protein